MEGMCGGNLSERQGNLCNRCGCLYSFSTMECPECKNLSDVEAKIKKQTLLNARADANKSIGYLFYFIAFILIILIVIIW